MKPWKAAALAGALLWGACSQEPAPTPTPAPRPAPQAAAPEVEPEAEPEAEEPAPAEEPEPTAEAAGTGAPPEFKLGQTREEVLALFGDCAVRREFVPPGPGSLYVEIYQAKDTEACRKRLGERHFSIRGGELHRITPGLLPPKRPRGAFKRPKDV
jgi:hypothetical protein